MNKHVIMIKNYYTVVGALHKNRFLDLLKTPLNRFLKFGSVKETELARHKE